MKKEEDFTYCFRLDDRENNTNSDYQSIVKSLLIDLLDIVVLTSKGTDLNVDGFRFQNSTKIEKLYATYKNKDGSK